METPLPITKVALVDDHRLFRAGLKEVINSFSGFKVSIEAEHGQDLIRKLFPDRIPDIALLDISMPIMDGFETARWLREHHPEVKLLALSMRDDHAAILRMLRSGVDGYILKNAAPAELRMALEAMEISGSYFTGSVSGVMREEMANPSPAAPPLTEEDIKFLELICTDLPYKAFEKPLNITGRAVEAKRERFFRRFGVKTRTALAVHAIRHGIVKLL